MSPKSTSSSTNPPASKNGSPKNLGPSPFSEPTDAQRNASRGEFVYQQLRTAISEGRFQPGARIREEEVAHHLGVSRTPVREAIRRLQTRGLLTMAPGSGLIIVELSKQQTLELYAFRELLEGAAARLAAQHVSPSEIDALRHIQEEFRQHMDDPKQLARINRLFHSTIIDAAHNQYMLDSLNNLTDALALLRNTTFSVPGRPETALIEHEAIITAIAARDSDAAEQAARSHIAEAQRARMHMRLTT